MNKLETFALSILELFEWLARVVYYGFPKNIIDSQKGTKAVAVLGNGNSLKELLDSSVNIDIDYCSVNFSPLTEFFFKVKPRYHVLADNDFFSCAGPELDKKFGELEKAMAAVDWDLYLFVPFVYRKEAVERYGLNPRIKLQYFNRNSLSRFFIFRKLKYWMYSKGWASPKMMNVGIAALYCLAHSGVKTIYMYGMEHSWLKLLSVDADNNVCMEDTHYYDKQKPAPIILYKDGRPQKLYEQLDTQAVAFASYWDIKGMVARLGGINIVNKTQGSFIDAFRKE